MRPTTPAPVLAFSFDGETIPAWAGQTLAAALTAAGRLTLRHTASGAARGLHCGMGACQECRVTVNGRPGQRACMTYVAEGMCVDMGADPASLPDLPPVPSPDPSHAPSRDLPPGPLPDALPERILTPAVLVVGGGPAGLSAAVAAHAAGAEVLLLDERSSLGGQYHKPAAVPDRQSRDGDRLRAHAAAVPTLRATVWGAFSRASPGTSPGASPGASANAPPDGPEIAAITEHERLLLRPRIVILAPGAHEAPLPLPGWTLPGCMTTGGLQTLVRTHRVLPGRRVVIAGNGPLNLRVAVEVLRAGGQMAAVVEAASRPSLRAGLRMAAASPTLTAEGLWLLAVLRRAGVPVLWNTRPVAIQEGAIQGGAIRGGERVEGLTVAGPGGVRAIVADIVALNHGFQAETGLARLLGVPHRVVDGQLEAITDPDGRTGVPGVFVVGDGARRGGAVVARHRGHAAGLAAAHDLGLAAPRLRGGGLQRAERFQRALWQAFAADPPDPASLPDPGVVCRCEEVTAGDLRRARADGAVSLATLKRATRAGMGHCAGRFCGVTVARLCGGPGGDAPGEGAPGNGAPGKGTPGAGVSGSGAPGGGAWGSGAAEESGYAAPRPPLRPVLAGLILADHGEPRDAAIARPLPTRWVTAAQGGALSGVVPGGTLGGTLGGEPAGAAVVVIGGGIVGLSTALYLAREGADVLVLDRGEPGMAASTANAGSLHIQLVPYVYAASGGGPMADALPLGPASVALWRDLARDGNEDLGLRTEGGLVLAETAADMALLRAKAAFERSRGIQAEVVGAADLRRIAPGLGDNFLGAAFCPQEGQGDPLRGTMTLLALARRAGARLAPGVEVLGLEPEGGGWRVTTNAGVIRAGQVVNAAGVQAGRIGALAGVTVPVHALVQQVIATEAAAPMLRQLVAWTGRHLSLKQGNGGHILVGGGWPGTQDANGAAQVRRESVEGNLELACRALPGLRGVHVLRAWTGLAPHLDRAPVISATPGLAGLWHGVTGNGYTLGPVVGRMLADAVMGRGTLPGAFGL